MELKENKKHNELVSRENMAYLKHLVHLQNYKGDSDRPHKKNKTKTTYSKDFISSYCMQ